MSLRTRHFREADHRAALVDRAFDGALARARAAVSTGAPDLNAVLRQYLRDALDDDVRRRLATPPGRPVYPHGWDGEQKPAHHDLDGNTMALIDAEEALEPV